MFMFHSNSSIDYQLSLTNPSDALHQGNLAANKGVYSVW